MLYYSETSKKCLFCKERCPIPTLKEGTEVEHEALGNLNTRGGDTPGDENHELNKGENEPLGHQSAATPEGNESEKTNESDPATKSVNSAEKRNTCSCYTFPVPFLGSAQDKWENVPTFQQNLKYAFVLRTLLDYPKRKIMKYLKQHCQLQRLSDASSDQQKKNESDQSDGWYSVCETCTKLVAEGHQMYHEIEKLNVRLDGLKGKLKDLIVSNQEGAKISEENSNIEDEDLEETIFSEVQDHFAPKKASIPTTDKSIVKLEYDTSLSSFSDDDDPLVDDLLTNENFDDGSDWAPSEAGDLDGDDDIDETMDIKPDINAMQLDTQVSKVGKGLGSLEPTLSNEEAAVAIRREKPGPKSRKMLRATRSSKRVKGKTRKDDLEEVDRENEEEDVAVDAIIVQDNSSRKRNSSKNVPKLKSILSDSESESLTESDKSDDSDYEDTVKEKYSCDICTATYHTKHRLRDHRKLHSSDESFKCTLCSFVAASNRGLNMHTTKIHQNKEKKKKREGLGLIRKEREQKRKRMALSEKLSRRSKKPPKVYPRKPLKVGDYKCHLCPVTYQTAHRLKEHEEHHLNMTSSTIKCDLCNYVCLLERGLKIHTTKYHSDENGSLVKGKHRKRTDSQEEFSADEDEEPRPEVTFPCDICCAVYMTRGRLRDHKKLHDRDDVTRCAECPYVCNTRKGLAMHMHEEHGTKHFRKEYGRRRSRKNKQAKLYATGPQQCDLCPAKYYTDHRFRQHMLLHSSEVNFPCDECGWVFSSEDKRSHHLKLSHKHKDPSLKSEPKSYQCSHCDIPTFTLRYKFKEHLLLNHKDKVFQCNACAHIYESQQLYELHIEKCYTNPEKVADDDDEGEEGVEEKKFACVDCNAKFSKQDMLNRHFALKHSTEQFPCSLCSSVFPTESRLRYHMARQHNKIQNVCKICGYKAHGASHLRLHMQKHTKERLFACEICGKTFVSPTYLTAHRQKEHYDELGLEPLKCDQCDLLFPNNSILKYHKQKIHEKKFKFFCESCGKGFLFASGLKNHSAIHSNERTEICQICGASYVHNRVLMEHIKHHHPEEYAAVKGIDPGAVKPATGFNTQGPFICKFCNMEFPSRWGLHNHMKSHTEVYDKYKCGICGKGYSSPAGVKRHEETSHVAATYSCQSCDKTFPCKDYLRYHVKNHCNKKRNSAPIKSDPEPGPSTAKQRKGPEHEMKITGVDPHIVKEAGLLHIVTPGTAAASNQLQGNIQQAGFTSAQILTGSSSASPNFTGVPNHQQNESLNDPFYRSYYSQQHGFHNK